MRFPTPQLLIFLSALAGGLHVLAPDHWVPSSLLSWQRGWRFPRAALFAALAFVAHVGSGFLIYAVTIAPLGRRYRHAILAIGTSKLLALSILAVVLVLALRAVRFNRIKDVF